eukprot:6703837-Pyramimonas_sp.AAC.1
MHTETYRQTDRQADRQTGKQTDRQTGRQPDRQRRPAENQDRNRRSRRVTTPQKLERLSRKRFTLRADEHCTLM